MNIEENRLASFRNWPVDAAVSPSRIARAGFFSLNRDLAVQCFWCGLEITEWNYGDQVMALHRELRPECEFVINPATSGNVHYLGASNALIDPTDLSDTAQALHPLTNENLRLQTFDDWPVSHIVTPSSLARAGFYYLKESDKTQCAFCNGIAVQWEVGDNPDVEHRRYFPNCTFVQRTIIPRLENAPTSNIEADNNTYERFTNVNLVGQNNFSDLGINAHRRPKTSRYSTLESRIQSFSSWPDDLTQTPNALAQAGFYYEGFGDQVRCFHCDGGLRHWDPHDDPWTEHCRWFPECPYVLLVKGQTFVNACALDTGGINVDQESRRTTRAIRHRIVTDGDIQAQMLTPEVTAALNIGLQVDRIKQAIKEKLEQTGTGFSTADAVIEAAFNLHLDEEDAPENTQMAQEVTRILTDAVEETMAENITPTPNVVNTVAVPVAPVEVSSQIENDDANARCLEEENRVLKEARLCKICMDVEVGIVFLPCGHLTTCVSCAPNLQYCPVCRSSIKATVRTFLS